MVSRWMDNGNMLDYLNRTQEPIDRHELVSSYSDHAGGTVVYSFTAIASSCLVLSVALITCIRTKLFTEI